MSSLTDRFALKKMGAGDTFSADSYQFTGADRDRIDALLAVGAETHRHTGEAAEGAAPDALTLVRSSGGSLPAGATARYKVSLVDPNGLETAASPEAAITMPAAVVAPGAPVLTPGSGGTMPAGAYYYVLSAYTDTSTLETLPGPLAYLVLSAIQTKVTITLPALPAGATGFNIYRQSPGESNQFFLASVDMSVLTPPTTYIDTGAVAELCDRRRPTLNTTVSDNKVTVSLADGLTAGWTWKVYRTLNPSNYVGSFLHHVTSGTSWVDTGAATSAGQPSDISRIVGSPPQVILVSETSGDLPVGRVDYFPFVVTFSFIGTQVVAVGSNVWVCEFPAATILWVRASLGRGYAPAAADLIVDVNKGTGTSAIAYTTIFSTQGDRPRIAVGAQIGARALPNAGLAALVAGNSLTVDVDQVGGGATPTDLDLTVNIGLTAVFTNAANDRGWS